MKTTIDLTDDLAARARRVAADEGTTLRSIIEEALRRELDRRSAPTTWRPSRDFVVNRGGLTDEASLMSWDEIREIAMHRSTP